MEFLILATKCGVVSRFKSERRYSTKKCIGVCRMKLLIDFESAFAAPSIPIVAPLEHLIIYNVGDIVPLYVSSSSIPPRTSGSGGFHFGRSRLKNYFHVGFSKNENVVALQWIEYEKSLSILSLRSLESDSFRR